MESTTGSSFVSYKGCNHDASAAIEIGGYPIFLAASPALKAERLAAAQVLLPLNGQIPARFFGQGQLVFCCSLEDHGGVPANWAEFIKNIAENYMPKHYNMVAWCHGSHGRTGCFAASLVAHMMPEIDDPIAWIREKHCKHAVESKKQAEAVFAIKGQSLPALYVEEFSFKSSFTSYGSGFGSEWYPGKTYIHDIELCECSDCKTRILTLPKGQKIFTSSGHAEPCTCSKWDACKRDREGFKKRKEIAALPGGIFLSGSMDDPKWKHDGPWFWGKRYMHCKDCTCDDWCKARASHSGVQVAAGIIWRLSPCSCTWLRCKENRSQWAMALATNFNDNGKLDVQKLEAYLLGDLKEGQEAAPKKPRPCISSGDCLCPSHIAQATLEPSHRDAINCCCRDCAIMEKLFSRGDLEYCHAQSKHPDDCMCKASCWFLATDSCAEGCLCNQCLWLNTEAEELEHLIDKEFGEDATNGKGISTQSSGANC